MTNQSSLLDGLIDICLAAAQPVMAIYDSPFDVREKDDKSPVTDADEAAEEVILPALAALAPDVPIVAEESAAAGNIPDVDHSFFLVDPVDGTKEFINRNDEFTVNIALIENHLPKLGVVYAPALNRLFAGEIGKGAFVIEGADPHLTRADWPLPRDIEVNRVPDPDGLIVVASRSHRDHKTDELLDHYHVKEFVIAGSSLKFCLVAAGEADLYPRHGPTMEWDTAAGHAVLAAAGGKVDEMSGAPLRYGKRDFRNGYFIAKGGLTS